MNIVDHMPLESLEDIKKRCQPRTIIGGIYFLFNKGKLQYVGQSINIHQRVMMHDAFHADSYAFIPYENDDIDLLEFAYITKYKPPHNGAGRYNRGKRRKEIKGGLS